MKAVFVCLTAAALCLSLAGCMGASSSGAASSSSQMSQATAAPSPSPSTEPASSASSVPSASTAPDTALSAAVVEALNGTVAFASDTAGGSLKTAQAASALVQVFAENGVPDNLQAGAAVWKAALTEEQRSLLSLNWSGVSQLSRDIAADPAGQQGLLDSAGIATDFTVLDLSGISAAMDSLDAALMD